MALNSFCKVGEATEKSTLELINSKDVQQGQSQKEKKWPICSICGKTVACGPDCTRPLCSDCYRREDDETRIAPRNKSEPLL